MFKQFYYIMTCITFVLLCIPAYSNNIVPDQSEQEAGDNLMQNANRLHIAVTTDLPHLHNFHTRTDEDWFVFYGLQHNIYTIYVMVEPLNSHCNPVIEIYDIHHNRLAYQNNKIQGKDEVFVWTKCDHDAIYYIRLTHSTEGPFGDDTAYDIRLYLDVAMYHGNIEGNVFDIFIRKSIAYGRIKTNESLSALSMPEIGMDYFIFDHKPGTYQLFVEADGYISCADSVTVEETLTIQKDIYMYPDFNADNIISLSDVLIALKILNRKILATHNNIKGLESVIGIMQKLAVQ